MKRFVTSIMDDVFGLLELWKILGGSRKNFYKKMREYEKREGFIGLAKFNNGVCLTAVNLLKSIKESNSLYRAKRSEMDPIQSYRICLLEWLKKQHGKQSDVSGMAAIESVVHYVDGFEPFEEISTEGLEWFKEPEDKDKPLTPAGIGS